MVDSRTGETPRLAGEGLAVTRFLKGTPGEGMRLLRNVLDEKSIALLAEWTSRVKQCLADKPICMISGPGRSGKTCLQFAVAMAVGGHTRFVTWCELANARLARAAQHGASLLMMSDGAVFLERLRNQPNSMDAISGLSVPLCITMRDDPAEWMPKEFLERECLVLETKPLALYGNSSQIHVRDQIAWELQRQHEVLIGGAR